MNVDRSKLAAAARAVHDAALITPAELARLADGVVSNHDVDVARRAVATASAHGSAGAVDTARRLLRHVESAHAEQPRARTLLEGVKDAARARELEDAVALMQLHAVVRAACLPPELTHALTTAPPTRATLEQLQALESNAIAAATRGTGTMDAAIRIGDARHAVATWVNVRG